MYEDGEFLVQAEASPGLLCRLLQPFAKRDLVPDNVEARRDGAIMRITLGMRAMPREMVHLVEGNLGQVIGVFEVRRRGGLRAAA